MFGTLTTPQLHDLHASLGAGSRAVHARMLVGLTPLIPVFSDQWQILGALTDDLGATMGAVYAEIASRETPAARH
jgi:hypothetical protein